MVSTPERLSVASNVTFVPFATLVFELVVTGGMKSIFTAGAVNVYANCPRCQSP